MTKEVDPDCLESALTNLSDRFPYFMVTLKRGLFWYYFERAKENAKPEQEAYYPCMFLNYKKKHTFPFRVLYFNRKISLEISHSITDGTGAVIFLKSLIAEYFSLKGIKCEEYNDILIPEGEVDHKEYEDAFHRYYSKKMPGPESLKNAWHFSYRLTPKGQYSIVTGIMPTENISQAAKKYNCTIGQFFAALYFKAIQSCILLEGKSVKRPVVINIPVNLRKIFPSKTMKNFFISISPSLDFRLGNYGLEEIIIYLQNYMKLMINEKKLGQLISRNVKPEKKNAVRITPLWIKKIITKAIFAKFGEKKSTTSFSNLGKITLPAEIEPYVERFEFYPPPGKGNIIKAAMVSYKDKTFLTFGSLSAEKTLERIFFRSAVKLGIPVKIETNGVY